MSIHKEYEPKLRKNYFLGAASGLFTVAAAALWIFRERLMLDTRFLIMLSGIALLMILMTIVGYRRKKECYLRAEELKRRQEEMNTDFSDSGIFFK